MAQPVKGAPDYTKVRLVYDSNFNIVQIREFSALAKLGEQRVDVTRLLYSSELVLIRIEPLITKDHVTYLDLGVPPKPVITATNPASPNAATTIDVIGTCTIDDGAIVYIYANGSRLNEVGSIVGNNFTVTIDLAAAGYSAPATILLEAEVQNNEGNSERSSPLTYNLI